MPRDRRCIFADHSLSRRSDLDWKIGGSVSTQAVEPLGLDTLDIMSPDRLRHLLQP